MKKMTTEQFVTRALDIHGEKYDYSKSHYVSYRTPITIVCPIHGTFNQLPSNHLKGSGCLLCSHDEKKTTTERFINHCRKVHNNKYNYSKVVLDGVDNKVTIICPEHGEFEQRAASHLNGVGCSKCAGVCKSSTDEFIIKAAKKHKSKYTYEKVKYKNTHTKVRITCSDHGDFLQTPADHLHGHGCPSCGGNLPVMKKDFVKRAKEVHGTKYNYSKLAVEGMDAKGTIICDIHGEFQQRLADHLSGHGCPECSLSKRGQYSIKYFQSYPDEKEANAILYLAQIGDAFCKVGITKRTVAQRFGTKEVQKIVEAPMSLYEAYSAEQQILEKFKYNRFRAGKLRSRGFVGWTECFPLKLVEKLKEEIVSRIKQ